jgi:dienelactone hydrolase
MAGRLPSTVDEARSLSAAPAYQTSSDREYRTVGGHVYPLDVYQPSADTQTTRPAVILVHGQAHPALLRDAKSWPALRRLARALAERGTVAVVPNLGSTATGAAPSQQFANAALVADNVVAAVRHVQAHAVSLGVDRRRLALWVAAEGGLYGLAPALGGELNGAVRCAVAIHPWLSAERLAATRPALGAGLLERLRPAGHLRRHRRGPFPILIVRAEQDGADVNQAIDDFVEVAGRVEAPVSVVRHEGGHHAFDAVDGTAETGAAFEQAMTFLERNL